MRGDDKRALRKEASGGEAAPPFPGRGRNARLPPRVSSRPGRERRGGEDGRWPCPALPCNAPESPAPRPDIRRRNCCEARSTALRAQGIDSSRGFFLLSPPPQKVESSAKVGPFALRDEAGCLAAEDVPFRKDCCQVGAEARAPEVAQPSAPACRAGDGAAAGPSTGRPESPSPQGQGRLNP